MGKNPREVGERSGGKGEGKKIFVFSGEMWYGRKNNVKEGKGKAWFSAFEPRDFMATTEAQ